MPRFWPGRRCDPSAQTLVPGAGFYGEGSDAAPAPGRSAVELDLDLDALAVRRRSRDLSWAARKRRQVPADDLCRRPPERLRVQLGVVLAGARRRSGA